MFQAHPFNGTPPKPGCGSPGMAAAPLAVAYVALPCIFALEQNAATGLPPFLPWTVLAGIGCLWAMLFRRPGGTIKRHGILEALAFSGLAFALFLRRDILIRLMDRILPFALELAPLAVIGFCLAWAMTFGVPDKAAFRRYGAVLGVLCIGDLALGLALHQAVPVQRWLGDSDILAGLLLVSLCAGLQADAPPAPGRSDRLCHTLILLGLAASLSRTGLFAAGWIILFFGNGTRPRRLTVSLALFSLLVLTFVLPQAQADGGRYLQYWLWAQSFSLFFTEPWLLLTGLEPAHALPFTIPMELVNLWEQAMTSPALFGVSLPQIQAFWLRVLLGWGALAPLAVVTMLCIRLSRHPSPMGAGLVTALIAQGMSTPLFHDPATGISLGLALILALYPGVSLPGRNASTTGEPDKTPGGKTDTTSEWDMRPLTSQTRHHE